MKNKNIVVIGGATGIFQILTGLKKYPINLSAIVTMADDGGSTGRLRNDLGVLPPGDVRRALIALSQLEKHWLDLFNYRFKNGELLNHNFGNIFLSALEKVSGSFEKAVELAGKLLNTKGTVIPVTLQDVRLNAILEDGTHIVGETNIDIPKHNGYLKIKDIFLTPQPRANPKAIKAIKNADLIIIGPGDLYTSVIPNLLVKNIPQAIKNSKAKKVYISNLMTKYGETTNFKLSDFVAALEKYLGKKVLDFVLYNNKKPNKLRLKKYSKENSIFVEKDISDSYFKIIDANLITEKGFIRHDPQKTAKAILALI